MFFSKVQLSAFIDSLVGPETKVLSASLDGEGLIVVNRDCVYVWCPSLLQNASVLAATMFVHTLAC